jgi:WD40 repeat protein
MDHLAIHATLSTVLRGHAYGVSEVRFAPNGSLLASSDDKVVVLWDVSTRTVRWTLGMAASNLTFSPKGDLLAFTAEHGVVQLRNFEGDLIAELPRHEPLATSVTFSPDGAWVVTGDSHGNVRIWDVSTQQLILPFHAAPGKVLYVDQPTAQQVHFLTFTPDGSRLAVSSVDQQGRIQLWEVERQRPEVAWKAAALDPRHDAWDLRGAPNGQFFAVANPDRHTVDLLRATTLEPMGHLDIGRNGLIDVPIAIAFSPTSDFLAVAAGAGSVFIWDLQSRQIAAQYAAHTDGYGEHTNVMEWPIGAIDWSPVGDLIATTGMSHATNYDSGTQQFTGIDDFTIKLWDMHLEESPSE